MTVKEEEPDATEDANGNHVSQFVLYMGSLCLPLNPS